MYLLSRSHRMFDFPVSCCFWVARAFMYTTMCHRASGKLIFYIRLI
uniref:Uncharacterized protein n=1 Tax=Anguilla anguilla TaxID=7936 RepID=A0A0E9PV94_ANGAN